MTDKMRPHITHFNDCGCLSARKDAEIARLREAVRDALVWIDEAIADMASVEGDCTVRERREAIAFAKGHPAVVKLRAILEEKP
jgi:hypothetical protein